jgi:hypothetical protein
LRKRITTLHLAEVAATIVIIAGVSYIHFSATPNQADTVGGAVSSSLEPSDSSTIPTAVSNSSGQTSYQWTTMKTQAKGSTVDIVGSSLDASLAGYPSRNEFQANGLTWLFYTNGSDMLYQSDDNGTWSSPSYLRPQTAGYHFSVWYDSESNILYYASVNAQNFPVNSTADGGSGDCQEPVTTTLATIATSEQCLASGFWYRWGTPESNGTISWLISEGFVQTGTYAANPDIYGNGTQKWVSLLTNGGYSVDVWKNNGTAWSRVLEIPTTLGTITVLTPLRSGLAVVYFDGYYNFNEGNRYGAVSIITTTDGGVSWSQPVTTSYAYVSASVLAVGNTVYLTGVDNSSAVRFWSYSLGSSSLSGELQIASNATASFISSDGTSKLVLFYTDGQSVFSTESSSWGSSWGPQDLVASSSGTIVAPLLVPYTFSGSELPICWTSTGSQPEDCDVACTTVPA